MLTPRLRKHRRPYRLWQTLEDRILFDAVVDPAMMDDGVQEEPVIPDSEVEQTTTTSDGDQTQIESVRRELVIIDKSVEGYEQLVSDLLGETDPERDLEVVLLDVDTDGIDQVTNILDQHRDLDALHIVSHGEAGAFRLGATWIDDVALTASAGQISGWGDGLANHGDILLYGCDVAGNVEGQELIESLSALTGQQVAASDDDTGASNRGGDWNLEYTSGDVETSIAFSDATQKNYAYVLAAGPVVTPSPDQDVMIGEEFTFTATFDNTGSDPGFGPYIDLIIPTNGADGAAGTDTADGINFSSATYLGQLLTTWELIFPDDGGGTGTIDHPFWVDNTNTPLQITGTTGDTLVVIELPFGSVTPGQPPIGVDITASVSNLADAGTPLNIQMRSGFRYGEDALDNPTHPDPSIVSDSQTDVTDGGPQWAQQLAITPTLITLDKEYLGPEDETATGPNHVQQYQIAVDVADGQTISNLDIIDSLPNNIIITSIDSVTVGGSSATFTSNLGSLTLPGNSQELTVTLTNNLVGTSSTSDAIVTFSFYVNELDADGNRVIPISGEDDLSASQSANNARAVGDWDAIDIRDGSGTDNAVADPVGVEHTLDGKSIAIQKSVAVVGGGEAVPGAVLEYTLTFQISDYYTFGDLVINDVFQDGQLFDNGFGATFNVSDLNGTLADSFIFNQINRANGDPDDANANATLIVDEADIDLADNALENAGSTGSTSMQFDLSQAMIDRAAALTLTGEAADGILQGGRTTATDTGAATGTIRFRTVVQEDYADTFPSTDRSVDQGDVITNDSLAIGGTVRQNAEDGSIATTLLALEEDASAASIEIATGSLTKEVYAVNGSTTLSMGANGLPVLVAGDVVTYRVTYTMPTSDVEDLTLTDFLPLPIFEVNDHNADGTAGDAWTTDFDESVLDAISGTIELGANDDFFAESGITPSITIDAANNELRILYGNYDDLASDANTIELYISVTAQDAPTADGLFLTNIVRASEGTTQLEARSTDGIAQIEVTQPVLDITKGLVGSFETINQIQRLSASAGFTGTYTLTIGGDTTTTIASTADAAAIRAAIIALPSIGASDVTVTGGPLISGGNPSDDPVVIEFTGSLEGISVGTITTNRVEITSEEISAAVTFNDIADTSGNGLFAGRITSGGMETNPIDTDLIDLDAGDRVRYAIVVENTGNSARGAFDVTIADSMPAGLSLVTSSLQVVDGNGNVVAYTGTEADFFSGGITLDDPSVSQGSLDQYNTASGDNIVVIFYEAEVGGFVEVNRNLTNTASLTNYAGREGGEDHTPTDLTDTARLTTLQPVVNKTLVGSEINSANNNNSEVVIGEYVDYQIVVSIPEGQMSNFRIDDVLDAGLSYVNGSAAITASSGLVTTQPSFNDVATNATVTSGGRNINFDFGTLTNTDRDNTTSQTITITLRAIVTNVAGNQSDTDLNNTATAHFDSRTGDSDSTANVEVLEPIMVVDLSANTASADVGNPITFTLTITNTSDALGTDAYNVSLEDILPSGLTFAGNLTHDSGIVPTNLSESGGTITADWASFAMGLTSVITFDATTNASMTTDGVTNTANLEWTSLSGDPGARTTHSAFSTERTGDDTDPGTTLNDYNDSDSALIAFPITPVKAIIATSESHTPDSTADSGADPRTLAIGEMVTYELRTAVGEGTLNNVIFRDLLTSGLTLLPGTVTFEIVADTNMTIDAALNGANSGVISLPAGNISVTGGATQTIDFDLGNIVNNDNDAGLEELVITFQAIVSNDAANNDSDVRTNNFQFREGGQNRGTSNTVTAVIVEPEIANVNKRVTTTNTSGNLVTYEITFSNTGDTSAFDVRVLDTMATELTLNTGSVSVSNTGSVSGIDNSNSAAGTLDLRIGEMAASSSVTITYTVNVAFAGNAIQNDADVTYTSLPGVQGTSSATPGASGAGDGERNGGIGVNDYADSDRAFLGSISDHVFYDINGDGIDNGSDVGIAGVTVNLVWFGVDGIEGNADDVARSTVTNASGDYLFGALPAGSFRVSVAPGSLPNGITTPTFDLDGIGTASAVVTTLSDSAGGIIRSDVDFGYTGSAQLGDFVWLDIDGDGNQDTGEMGLANVDVNLTWHGFNGTFGDIDDVAYTTATTNNTGGYNFTRLPAGSFTVNVDGTSAPSSTTLTTGNDPVVVALTVGQDYNDADFGFRGPGSIGDFVFFDSNNNGAYDVGTDSAFPGVTVTWSSDIDGDGIQETFQAVTDDNGAYNFVGLPLDSYTVTVTPPTGTSPTVDATGLADNQSSVTLTSGVPARSDQDFGLTGSGSIGDVVFWDHDGNGVQNGGEVGLSGVTVQLQVDLDGDSTNEITLSTTTAADGSYGFNNLPPGSYTVIVTQPSGTTQTVDDDGLGTANRSSLVLSAGQTRNDQDFGYNGTGSIGDLVYFDYVGDGGVFNGGEDDRGMGGVDVTLNVDVNGDTVSDFTLTTTTAADGSYGFSNLVAGDYTITVDSGDLPDQMGNNPTYDTNGVGSANTSTLTLAAGATNALQDFGYHAVPDYNVVIDDGNLAVEPGESLTYTVTVRNDGTLRGNNAVVTVAFPNDLLESVAASTSGIVNVAAGTVTWNSTTTPALSVMNVGEEVVFTINADVVQRYPGGYSPITLTANVTDDLVNGVDPDMTDNTNNDIDQVPEIGVAKRLVSSTSAATGGNRELTYEVVVRNLGSIDLTDLSLFEDLNAQFGPAFQGVITPPGIVASTAATNPDFASGGSTWNGNSNTDMFDGASGLLQPDEQYTIRFTVEVDVDQLGPGSNNQVRGTGDWDVSGIETGTVHDLSDTGTDPDGNNPGVPGDSGGFDDPTLVPAIGIAKDHGNYTEWLDSNGDGTGVFNVPTTLVIENLGATDLTNLNLRDDLATIYGAQFVSASNLALDTTGVVGATSVTPTLNFDWESDTSQNMLSSGTLNPGDTFTVTFLVALNPDAGGQSGYMDNQATIIASDPTNPTATVLDLSDSGLNPNTNNTGEPGDMATADDPTPVAVADIGLAKSIIDARQLGLSYELTIQLVLENNGTVDLENIGLVDDIADQYGTNFSRVIGQPVIVGSTATATPTLNSDFAGDTSQPIFDGTSGFLQPGETITLHIAVEVVSQPGQTEITVINQATTSADPLDENGDPLEDNSGNPIGRISDRSDSGTNATGPNPGAPGDTGSWDDPTPQKLTFFTFDSYNDFSQGRKSQQLFENRDPSDPFDVGIQRIDPGHRSLSQDIPRLATEPIFSGSARPGTQVIGRVFDSAGRLIGEELAFADVGGNWMMQFHNLRNLDHGRFEFVEVAGNSDTFDSRGDVYGYLGTDSLNNDYASLEPWTSYDRSYEFTANYRPTVPQSLMQKHQQNTKPIGFGR